MIVEMKSRTERIAELNDRCRLGLDPQAKHMLSRGCLAAFASGFTAEGIAAIAELLESTRVYEFEPGDGRERDFGSFDFRGQRICFKIDYYDLALEFGSEDPADPSITTRVMTVMLTSDH